MIKKIKSVWKKYGKTYGVVNVLVLLVSLASLPQTCYWIVYQPDIPQELMEIKE